MRRITLILLIAALMLFAAGCGQTEPIPTTKAADEAQIIIETGEAGTNSAEPATDNQASNKKMDDTDDISAEQGVSGTNDNNSAQDGLDPQNSDTQNDSNTQGSPDALETSEAQAGIDEQDGTTAEGVIAKSDNTVSDQEKEDVLNELCNELDSLLSGIDELEDVQDSDLKID